MSSIHSVSSVHKRVANNRLAALRTTGVYNGDAASESEPGTPSSTNGSSIRSTGRPKSVGAWIEESRSSRAHDATVEIQGAELVLEAGDSATIEEQLSHASCVKISDCQLSPGVVHSLTECLCRNGTVKRLEFTKTKLDKAAIEAIARVLTKNVTLRELIIQKCSIGKDAILTIIRALTNNKGLEHLRFPGETLVKKDLEIIAQELSSIRNPARIELTADRDPPLASYSCRLFLLARGSGPNNVLTPLEKRVIQKSKWGELCWSLHYAVDAWFDFRITDIKSPQSPQLVRGSGTAQPLSRHSWLAVLFLALLWPVDLGLDISLLATVYPLQSHYVALFAVSIILMVAAIFVSVRMLWKAGRKSVASLQLLGLGSLGEQLSSALPCTSASPMVIDVSGDHNVVPLVGAGVTCNLGVLQTLLLSMPQTVIQTVALCTLGANSVLIAALVVGCVAMAVGMTAQDIAVIPINSTVAGAVPIWLPVTWRRCHLAITIFLYRFASQACLSILLGLMVAVIGGFAAIFPGVMVLLCMSVYWYVDQTSRLPVSPPVRWLQSLYPVLVDPGLFYTRTTSVWLPRPVHTEAEAASWTFLLLLKLIAAGVAIIISFAGRHAAGMSAEFFVLRDIALALWLAWIVLSVLYADVSRIIHGPSIWTVIGRCGFTRRANYIHACDALFEACRSGHFESVNMALQQGADPNYRKDADWGDPGNTASPLLMAAYHGYAPCVQALLQSPSVNFLAVDADRRTALILAASQGHRLTVQVLLSVKGAKPNTRDKNGRTAIMHAALGGYTDIVKAFLAHPKTSLNLRAYDGNTALTLAVKGSHQDTVDVLLANADIVSATREFDALKALHFAASAGCTPIVSAILQRLPVNADTRDSEGNTALFLAASHGRTDTIRALLRIPNIDINARNSHGQTALMEAADKGYVDIVQLLTAMPGLAVDVKDVFSGCTALQRAAGRGHAHTVHVLLSVQGVDINSRDKWERTALMEAAENGHTEIVRDLLLQPGQNINAVDRSKRSALMIAARKGHDEVVRLLLAYPDINVNLQDNDGNTALMLASARGRIDSVRALLGMPDIDLKVRNLEGRTALDYTRDILQPAVAEQVVEMISQLYQTRTPAEERKAVEVRHDRPPHSPPMYPAKTPSLARAASAQAPEDSPHESAFSPDAVTTAAPAGPTDVTVQVDDSNAQADSQEEAATAPAPTPLSLDATEVGTPDDADEAHADSNTV